MPHYKDGTPARHGDLILHTESHDGGMQKVGIVTSISSQSDTCNANIIQLASRQKGSGSWHAFQNLTGYVTLKECDKIDAGELGVRERVMDAMASG